MRRPVPRGISEWWDEAVPQERLSLSLAWRGGTTLTLGEIHPGRNAVRFAPEPADFSTGAERVPRLVGKALTRAGWRRPQIDPAVLPRLLQLRRDGIRLQFIFDTNAMVEGVGHWLVDHFADRCDLIVTAVSLRELQDVHARARFGKQLPEKGKKIEKLSRGDILGARQLYLAANRFRERSGFDRVLWMELELDDTALLLSRGAAGNKSSESDTLLLRAVRRSIHDRVNGLERFFVTGDTALARRATSELPPGSVIAAQVRPVEPGEVLLPCAWWPGPDEGCRVSRHMSRLVWELLCIGDEVILTSSLGSRWTFRAFDNPMWPSDYSEPWVEVEEPPAPAPIEQQEGGEPTSPGKEPVLMPEPADQPAAPHPPLWRPSAEHVPTLDKNLRLSGAAVLDLLSMLALQESTEIAIPPEIHSFPQSRHHIRMFLEGLELAEVDGDVAIASPLPRRALLADAWRLDDLDAVFDLIRGWTPLAEWSTLESPPKRPRRTQEIARSLAGLLGQGMNIDGAGWLPGAARPSLADVREAVLAAVPDEPPRALPIHTLLVDVFLRRLGVGPVRAARVWDRLWAGGAFEGFEPREGGSSSGQNYQEFAHLTNQGWELQRLDLESVGGTRDLVLRRTA